MRPPLFQARESPANTGLGGLPSCYLGVLGGWVFRFVCAQKTLCICGADPVGWWDRRQEQSDSALDALERRLGKAEGE